MKTKSEKPKIGTLLFDVRENPAMGSGIESTIAYRSFNALNKFECEFMEIPLCPNSMANAFIYYEEKSGLSGIDRVYPKETYAEIGFNPKTGKWYATGKITFLLKDYTKIILSLKTKREIKDCKIETETHSFRCMKEFHDILTAYAQKLKANYDQYLEEFLND